MQTNLVGHMRDIRLTGPDTADQRQRLLEVEMRRMDCKAQRIDHQHLHAAELLDLGILDGLEVGQISQRPDAEARDQKTFGVMPRNRNDLHAFDRKGMRNIDLMQFDLRDAAVFVLREGVVEILAHALHPPRSGVNPDLMDGRRVIDEIEGPDVVQTADMVLVFVG